MYSVLPNYDLFEVVAENVSEVLQLYQLLQLDEGEEVEVSMNFQKDLFFLFILKSLREAQSVVTLHVIGVDQATQEKEKIVVVHIFLTECFLLELHKFIVDVGNQTVVVLGSLLPSLSYYEIRRSIEVFSKILSKIPQDRFVDDIYSKYLIFIILPPALLEEVVLDFL